MERRIQKLSQEQYDVLVIGGGINGAAIAHTAAANGLKTALIEKNDFASGTSSKSTKLIHGGLRYLENFEFGLARESLRERANQLKSAPHLVHSLKFVVPVYKTDRRPFWMMKFGIWLYDFLSGKYVIEKHEVLGAEDVCRLVPGIEREGLVGGIIYSDAQMNDARLCLENVLSADEQGADAANYVEARGLLQVNGKTVGVSARDCLTGEQFEIKAKRIVSAVGPWTNQFIKKEHGRSPSMVRTTKGVHIVFKGHVSHYAILAPAEQDKRFFFIIPWMGNFMVGTTDTDYRGDPDKVEVEEEDVDYLIRETQRVLPHAELNEENIITIFAGLRPLVKEAGAPSKISRKHVIKTSYSGILYVLGGKYTTYRKIAEDVVGQLTKKPLADTREQFSVYGSGHVHEDPETVGEQYGCDPQTVQALMEFYGTRYRDVLALIGENPRWKEKICTCSGVIGAQVAYAIKTEMARHEEDIVMRRLTLGFRDCPTRQCREFIRSMLSEIEK